MNKKKPQTCPFNTDEFNALKTKWYKTLKDEGFNDIESTPPNKSQPGLIQWHAFYFQAASHGFKGPDFFRAKADYFYYAAQFLERGAFDSMIEKEVWALHADGWGVRESARILNLKLGFILEGHIFTRDKVWRMVKGLKLKMRAFLWDGEKVGQSTTGVKTGQKGGRKLPLRDLAQRNLSKDEMAD